MHWLATDSAGDEVIEISGRFNRTGKYSSGGLIVFFVGGFFVVTQPFLPFGCLVCSK